jgi:hypothetical protein
MPTGCFVGIDRCHYRLLAYPPFHFIIHLFFHSWDWRTNKVQATGKIVRVGDLHGVLEWIDLTAPTNRISIPYLCSKRFSLIYFFEQVQSCGEEPEHPNIGSPFQLRASSYKVVPFFPQAQSAFRRCTVSRDAIYMKSPARLPLLYPPF